MTILFTAAVLAASASIACDYEKSKAPVAEPVSRQLVGTCAPGAAAAPALLHVGNPRKNLDSGNIEIVELSRSGDSIAVTRENGMIIISVDGEVAAKIKDAVDGVGFYKLLSSDGEDFGSFVYTGQNLMFSNDINLDFEISDDFGFGNFAFVQDKDQPETRLFARSMTIERDQPKVMLGITMESGVPGKVLRAFDLNDEDVTFVQGVIAGLPAELGGLHAGDVIYRVDGIAPADIETIRTVLRKKLPGDSLEVGVIRGKTKLMLEIVLAPYSQGALNGEPWRPMGQAGKSGKEIAEQITELRSKMKTLSETISQTRDRQKLRELSMKMAELGESIGQIAAQYGANRSHSLPGQILPAPGQFRGFTRIVVPEWIEGKNEDAFNNLRFLVSPDGDNTQHLDRLNEIIERIVEANVEHTERYDDSIREYAEIFAERAEEHVERSQEHIERLVTRIAEQRERHIEEIEVKHESHTSDLEDRLDELDDRLDRLEDLLERLLDRDR